MPRFVRSVALVLILCVFSQISAWADAVQGRVAAAGPQSLDMTVYDPQGRPYPNALHLNVDATTEVSGASSISELRPNDPVEVDVHQQENKEWHADRVSLFQQVNVQPATKNPPPTMRDVLGQPVVRGALLGAATGAIAASASGGKAGKGALVGAGVGAAASLLGGLFSGKSRSSQDSNQN